MANLKPVDWKEVAKRGCFVYAYLRQHDHTPYYIGVASQYQRPFQKHHCELPAYDALAVLLRSGLTWDEACDWEIFYISHYGRQDLGTGILRNQKPGGEGAPDPERTAKRLGVPLELILNASRTVITRLNKRYAEGMRGDALLDGLNANLQSFTRNDEACGWSHRSEANAETFGVTLEEWKNYTQNERRRAKVRVKNGTSSPEAALKREHMFAGSTKPNAFINSAKKFGICPVIWFCYTETERSRLRKRYRDGKRGLELIAPRQQSGNRAKDVLDLSQLLKLREQGLSLRSIAASLDVGVWRVRNALGAA